MPVGLTHSQFGEWLEQYGRASAANDPQASAELFTQDAEYYETPFDPPLIGREAIYRYWERGAQTLKDKDSAYEVLAVQDGRGLARWRAQFTVSQTGRRMALDCAFLVEFDETGRCRVFREWWHLQTLNTGPDEKTGSPLREPDRP